MKDDSRCILRYEVLNLRVFSTQGDHYHARIKSEDIIKCKFYVSRGVKECNFHSRNKSSVITLMIVFSPLCVASGYTKGYASHAASIGDTLLRLIFQLFSYGGG